MPSIGQDPNIRWRIRRPDGSLIECKPHMSMLRTAWSATKADPEFAAEFATVGPCNMLFRIRTRGYRFEKVSHASVL